jgi:hypothetical protein
MKHTQRYTDRIMKQDRDDGLEAAVRYGCDLIGCTKTELNKWVADGRLPHLFRRAAVREKSVECRSWAEDTLEAAKELPSVWRQQDVVCRKTQRTGLRLVGIAA